jgi:hypothetical protein
MDLKMLLQSATIHEIAEELTRRKVPYILLSEIDGIFQGRSDLKSEDTIKWLKGALEFYKIRLERIEN